MSFTSLNNSNITTTRKTWRYSLMNNCKQFWKQICPFWSLYINWRFSDKFVNKKQIVNNALLTPSQNLTSPVMKLDILFASLTDQFNSLPNRPCMRRYQTVKPVKYRRNSSSNQVANLRRWLSWMKFDVNKIIFA